MDMQSALRAMADGDVLDTSEVQARIGDTSDTPSADASEDSQLLVDLG